MWRYGAGLLALLPKQGVVPNSTGCTQVRVPGGVRYYQSYRGLRQFQRPVNGDAAVYGLLAANAAGWLTWRTHPRFMANNAVVSRDHLRSWRLHTLLTSCFSHQSGGHLLANSFTLYFFGSNLASVLGGAKFIRLYCFGGVVGNLAFLGLQALQQRGKAFGYFPGALGASGAVNSVVICQILMAPTATVLLYGVLPLPAWLLGLAWIGLDVNGAAQGQSQGGGTAFAGHLGGATIGAAAFLGWRRGLPF